MPPQAFVEDAMAASWGHGLPDIGMLRVLEGGGLDTATKSFLHIKMKENPTWWYADFLLELRPPGSG